MSISLKNISKKYITSERGEFYAIKDININFNDTGFYTIIGHSGSGKSTLLNIIGQLEKQSEGEIEYNIADNENFHKDYVSFVFQENNLIEEFSLIDNLKLVSQKDPKPLLEKVQLLNKINVPVNKLSGGEKQRLAIVRAVLKNCRVIILDEPTLNLDKKNSSLIINILKEISKTKLVIISTHDDDVIKFSDYIIRLKEGFLVENINLENTTFTFKNYDEDTIVNVYKIIKSKRNYNKCYCQINDIEINVYNENVLKNIYDNLKKDNNTIKLKFINESKNKELNQPKKINEKNKFNFALKYSLLILKRNFITTFFIILSLISTILLTIVMFNISFINSSDIIDNSRKTYQYSIYPIVKERYSFIQQKRFYEYNGKHHYEQLLNHIQKEDISLSFSVDIKNTPLRKTNFEDIFTVVLFNNKNYKNLLKTQTYNKNDIFVTDYINEIYLKNTKERNLQIQISNHLDFNLKNINTSTIKTNYQDLDFNTFEDNINISKHIFKFKNKIGLIYMSEDLFDELIKDKPIKLYVSNFLKNNIFELLRSHLIYKKYNNENIIYGNTLSDYNDIVVSEKFLLENDLKKEDVIGKEYKITDFSKLISKDDFDFVFNLANYSKTFNIKGITNNSQSDIFVNPKVFENIIKDYKYHFSNNISLLPNDNFKTTLQKLHKNKFNIQHIFDDIYSFENIKNSILKKFSIITCILLSIISFSLLISISLLLINSKRKQIAILKSIGKTNKDIFKIFLYNNINYLLYSIPIGFILAFINYKLLNYLLINLILKVKYPVLLNYFTSYILSALISILFGIITAFIPFIKINKIDIAEIKEY